MVDDVLERDLGAVLAADPEEENGSHVDPDELLAYLEDTLPEGRVSEVRDHLVGCAECAEALLDLEALSSIGDEPEVVDLEMEAAWRALRPRIHRSESQEQRNQGSSFLPRAVAALLVAVVGLSAWVAVLHRDLDATRQRLAAPQPNPPLVYLDGLTRSDGGVPEVSPSAAGDRLVLILTPDRLEPFPSYEVELLDDQGATIWQGGGLQMNELGTVRLGLAFERLPDSGEVTVRLRGVGDNRSELLGEYVFRVDER